MHLLNKVVLILKKYSIFLFLFVLSIIQGVRYINFNFDDCYIFYRYVDNILSGNSWVFNIGEKVNATTSPLNVIFISLTSLLIRDIPLAAHVIQTLFLFLSLVFIYLIFKESNLSFFGIIALLLWATNPYLMNSWGMESIMYSSLVVGSVYFFIKNKYNLTSFLLALLTLTRPDGILLACLIFVVYIIEKRKFPVKEAIIFILTILPWFAFSYFYFGSFLPHTFKAKVFQGDSTYWGKGFIFLKGLLKILNKDISFKLLFSFNILLIFIFGLSSLIKSKIFSYKSNKPLIIILLWGVLYTTSYTILNVPHYTWYYLPIFLFLTITLTYTILLMVKNLLLNNIKNIYINNVLKTIILVILLVPILVNFKKHSFIFSSLPAREKAYKEIGLWLKDNIKDASKIATLEVGTLAYFSKKNFLDLTGLTSPEMLANLKKEVSKEMLIKKLTPKYLLLRSTPGDYPGFLEPWIENNYIKINYSVLNIFNFNDFPSMTLLKLNEKIINIDNIDLYELFYKAKISGVTTKQKYQFTELTCVEINGEKRQAIVNIPPSVITYDIELKNKKELKFGIGLYPYNKKVNDLKMKKAFYKYTFNIDIVSDSNRERIYSKSMSNKDITSFYKWNDSQVDISKYENKSVQLIFYTESINNLKDYKPIWSNLIIE